MIGKLFWKSVRKRAVRAKASGAHEDVFRYYHNLRYKQKLCPITSPPSQEWAGKIKKKIEIKVDIDEEGGSDSEVTGIGTDDRLAEPRTPHSEAEAELDAGPNDWAVTSSSSSSPSQSGKQAQAVLWSGSGKGRSKPAAINLWERWGAGGLGWSWFGSAPVSASPSHSASTSPLMSPSGSSRNNSNPAGNTTTPRRISRPHENILALSKQGKAEIRMKMRVSSK